MNPSIDPLYTIFEQHLFNFQDPNLDRKAFIDGIVKEYLAQMRKMGFSIPSDWDEVISEELSFQVNTMLVKKIYGCQTINEFTHKATTDKVLSKQKKKANQRYQQMKKAA